MKKNNESLLGLAAIFGGLLGILGTLTLAIHLGDPTVLGLLYPTSPTPNVTTTVTSTVAPEIYATGPKLSTATPEPKWQVCTGIPNGHLHVREQPGHQTPILGVLPESTNITPTGQRDGDWLEISAPLTGWVNSKFICEVSYP